MPDLNQDLSTALSVRRGQRKLRDLPDDERTRISRLLRSVSGARFAELAQAQERQPERAFHYGRNRYASPE